MGQQARLFRGVQRGSGRIADRCGRTENTSSGRKCRLVPVSRFHSAESLDATGGTIRFRGIPLEKHCITSTYAACL